MISKVLLGLPALIILTQVQDKHPNVNKNASIEMSDFIQAEAPDGRRPAGFCSQIRGVAVIWEGV